MKMKKVKTSELSGVDLDRAVLMIEGFEDLNFYPSENWAQGGPIIEREKIDTNTSYPNTWVATCHDGSKTCTGPTPLVAAMRCYVASVMGDEVEVPMNIWDEIPEEKGGVI